MCACTRVYVCICTLYVCKSPLHHTTAPTTCPRCAAQTSRKQRRGLLEVLLGHIYSYLRRRCRDPGQNARGLFSGPVFFAHTTTSCRPFFARTTSLCLFFFLTQEHISGFDQPCAHLHLRVASEPKVKSPSSESLRTPNTAVAEFAHELAH